MTSGPIQEVSSSAMWVASKETAITSISFISHISEVFISQSQFSPNTQYVDMQISYTEVCGFFC